MWLAGAGVGAEPFADDGGVDAGLADADVHGVGELVRGDSVGPGGQVGQHRSHVWLAFGQRPALVRALTGPSGASRGRAQSSANQAATSASRFGSAPCTARRTRVGTCGQVGEVFGGGGGAAGVVLIGRGQQARGVAEDVLRWGVAGDGVLTA